MVRTKYRRVSTSSQKSSKVRQRKEFLKNGNDRSQLKAPSRQIEIADHVAAQPSPNPNDPPGNSRLTCDHPWTVFISPSPKEKLWIQYSIDPPTLETLWRRFIQDISATFYAEKIKSLSTDTSETETSETDTSENETSENETSSGDTYFKNMIENKSTCDGYELQYYKMVNRSMRDLIIHSTIPSQHCTKSFSPPVSNYKKRIVTL